MDMKTTPRADAAEIVLPAADFDATLKFFTERIGFRLDAIFPADDPATALVSGHGLRLRLERGGAGAPGTLRLLGRDPAALARAFGGGASAVTAPNGTRVEFAAEDPPYVLPPERPSFVVAKMDGGAGWASAAPACSIATSSPTGKTAASSPRTSAFPRAGRCPTTFTSTRSASR